MHFDLLFTKSFRPNTNEFAISIPDVAIITRVNSIVQFMITRDVAKKNPFLHTMLSAVDLIPQ